MAEGKYPGKQGWAQPRGADRRRLQFHCVGFGNSPGDFDVLRRLASRISEDYRGRTPLLVGALKGCFVFLADLVRELSVPFEVDVVRVFGRTFSVELPIKF